MLTLWNVNTFEADFIVFGPQTYVRGTGKPATVTKTFRVDHPASTFTLRVTNQGVTSAVISLNGRVVLGESDFTRNDDHEQQKEGQPERQKVDRGDDQRRGDDRDGVASATVSSNGTVVVQPSDFQEHVASVERPLTLQTGNELSVGVRGEPGSAITVQIIGIDHDPPVITAITVPPPIASPRQRESL